MGYIYLVQGGTSERPASTFLLAKRANFALSQFNNLRPSCHFPDFEAVSGCFLNIIIYKKNKYYLRPGCNWVWVAPTPPPITTHTHTTHSIYFSYGCLWVWVAMGVGGTYFDSAMGAGGVGGTFFSLVGATHCASFFAFGCYPFQLYRSPPILKGNGLGWPRTF